MKKRVSSSNLALRFYKMDGWTREVLEKYLIKGSLQDTEFTHHDHGVNAYYILKVGSRLDMQRLYDEQVSEVDRAFNDYPSQSDLQFMESYNWH
jgi:hypothetical protein